MQSSSANVSPLEGKQPATYCINGKLFIYEEVGPHVWRLVQGDDAGTEVTIAATPPKNGPLSLWSGVSAPTLAAVELSRQWAALGDWRLLPVT